MSTNDQKLEQLEKRLGGLALGGPGPEARARILGVARAAWQNPLDLAAARAAPAPYCIDSTTTGRAGPSDPPAELPAARWMSIWQSDLFRVAAGLAASLLIAAGVQWLDGHWTAAVAQAGSAKPAAEPPAMPAPREMAEWVGMNGDMTAYLKVVETLSRLPAPVRATRETGSFNREAMEGLL